MRVIVADDSKIMRDRFKSAVLAAGHEVVGEERSAKGALELCQKLRPDAAILDNAMPPMFGATVAKALRHQEIVKRVLVVSSNSQDSIVKPLHEVGIQTLTKPCGDPELYATVKAFLE